MLRAEWIAPMSEFIVSVSPALRLLLVLAFIVTLLRCRVPYGISFLGGAALLATVFPMGLPGFAQAARAGLQSQETLFLCLIISFVITLSGALDATGQIGRIIDSFKALVGASRWTLVAFPALIGLLPMPGGAVFSAPMVGAAIKDTPMDEARASAANYWFRTSGNTGSRCIRA